MLTCGLLKYVCYRSNTNVLPVTSHTKASCCIAEAVPPTIKRRPTVNYFTGSLWKLDFSGGARSRLKLSLCAEFNHPSAHSHLHQNVQYAGRVSHWHREDIVGRRYNTSIQNSRTNSLVNILPAQPAFNIYCILRRLLPSLCANTVLSYSTARLKARDQNALVYSMCTMYTVWAAFWIFSLRNGRRNSKSKEMSLRMGLRTSN